MVSQRRAMSQTRLARHSLFSSAVFVRIVDTLRAKSASSTRPCRPGGSPGGRLRFSRMPMTVSIPAPDRSRWRVALLLAAPHRLGFFAAALMMVMLAAWWAAIMAADTLGVPLPWVVVRPAAHAWAMTMGFMPLFFAGFVFTAVPKWLSLRPVPARRLRMPIASMLIGWPCALIGFHRSAALAAFGVGMVALGWSVVGVRFGALVRAGRVHDRLLHPRLIAAACGFGALLSWGAVAAIAMEQAALLRALALAALWGFIAPVFVVATDRLMPYLGGEPPVVPARWHEAPLWLVLTLLVAETMRELVDGALTIRLGGPAGGVASVGVDPLSGGAAVVIGPALFGIAEAAVALLLLALLLQWLRRQGVRQPLTTMLLISFGWLGTALALRAVAHVCQALGVAAVAAGLETAALHALALGYFGGMVFAMATRIAAGQAGWRIAGDVIAWRLWLLAQIAAWARVAGALWPGGAMVLLPFAALAWLLATGGWALRHGRWFGRPRADGRPG